jgi:hypothetical protein
VFTSLPQDQALDGLAGAMARAEQIWPRGTVYPAEAAFESARETLARVVGGVRAEQGWSVHAVPLANADSHSCPRSMLVVSVDRVEDAVQRMRSWAHDLLIVGTDAPDSAVVWRAAGAIDVVALGTMQRPPLDREDRGGPWVRWTGR